MRKILGFSFGGLSLIGFLWGIFAFIFSPIVYLKDGSLTLLIISAVSMTVGIIFAVLCLAVFSSLDNEGGEKS